MSKLGIGKGRTGSKQEALAGQDYKRMRPEPTHEQTVDVFKKHMGYKKGGVMDMKKLMQEKKPHSTSAGRQAAIERHHARWEKSLPKEPTAMEKGKAKAKEHKEKLKKLGQKGIGYLQGWAGKKKGGVAKKKTFLERRRQLSLGIGSRDKSPFLERRRKLSTGTGKKKGGKVDKKWIQKAVNPKHKGYCTPMTKPTCTPARKRLAKLFKSKAKKGWANGGTVVMPTVGNDVRTRAYKHGALIHPRPKPTTVAHGRGVGIAKRGW